MSRPTKDRLTVRDVMTAAVRTVKPGLRVPELEEILIREGLRGAPVVEADRLVGVVSRSDIVRQLCVERTLDAALSDYYFDAARGHDVEPLEAVGRRVGARIEDMTVRDVMVPDPQTVEVGSPIREAAKRLVERRMHRIPVVEGERLVGVLSTLDLARLVAEGVLVEAPA